MLEWIQTANTTLTPYGLTVSGIVTGAGVIIASFFSARFGASESRRQHGEKTRLEKLTAAGELLDLLQDFQHPLQKLNNRISEARAQSFDEYYDNYGRIEISKSAHKLAAVLGTNIVEEIIVLKSKFSRAVDLATALSEHVSPEDAEDSVLSCSARLLLDVSATINNVCRAVEIRIFSSPAGDREKLEELANLSTLNDSTSTLRF